MSDDIAKAIAKTLGTTKPRRKPGATAVASEGDMLELPDVRWGSADAPLPEITDGDDDDDPDDEELPETPPDVIEGLGFDPLDGEDEDDG